MLINFEVNFDTQLVGKPFSGAFRLRVNVKQNFLRFGSEFFLNFGRDFFLGFGRQNFLIGTRLERAG